MTGHVEHDYLSTSCVHGDMVLPDGRTGHEYCQGDTGHAGSKRPAECKFCGAPCVCPCHGGGRVLYLDTFGAQIETERRERHWSQHDLAARVGVGQQAISSWERGGSTPRGTTLELVRRVLGFTCIVAATSEENIPPETIDLPRVGRLPFRELDDSEFVNLAIDLLHAAYPEALLDHVSHQQRQRVNVDAHLTLPGGERIAVRCERSRKFQPASFDRVVRETGHIDADRCLLLVATSVSDNIKARAAATPWEIWDGDKLNTKIHALDADVATGLVKQYFPGLGKRFFGTRTGH